jgi:hypothetical protein
LLHAQQWQEGTRIQCRGLPESRRLGSTGLNWKHNSGDERSRPVATSPVAIGKKNVRREWQGNGDDFDDTHDDGDIHVQKGSTSTHIL